MFDIDENNNVILKETVYLKIKEYKDLWETDKTKNKDKALLSFAYLYLKNSFNSKYKNAYTPDELPEILKRDLELPKNWKEDAIYLKAEEKFNSLQVTKSLKLLASAESAMEQITKYFESFDISKLSEEKKAEAITKLMNNIKNVDEVVGKLEAAKDKVSRELETKKLSGTKKLSSRELPKNRRK